ncbi:nucleotidyltransferase family protein [Desulfurobacterium atlanticum]|uniref:Predicted nucleotidyltransferase n=1 Tax=Desulfurobacterium atlanticum TaxID=240169 RepID=A0A238XRD7_9BACT|nr:nucleotidyltransferase domain-containing protein [Desulfurobacterium atlanticum]SNR60569.1 Predicted nucleotidyltransferase [Desulfurobacterium atlanticum]
MKIRLTDEEIHTIKKLAQDIFGECKIYIFGSRLKDKKGGDIDIYVVPEEKTNLFKKKLKFSSKLENLLGKPVDVVVSRDINRKIEREALRGVRL